MNHNPDEVTLETVIAGFREGSNIPHTPERAARFNEICQENLKLQMELNSTYHTPEEIIQLMEQITGHPVDESLRMFPPFYTDFGI